MDSNFKFVLFVIVISFIKLTMTTNYCSVKQCRPNTHTSCIYNNLQSSPRCNTIYSSGLSNNEKRRILNYHNRLRQYVAKGYERRGKPGPQPPAKRMLNLTWDNEIASIAQRWANQCTFGHDKCRNVDRFAVGQNIAYMDTTSNVTSIKVETMIKFWYDEVKYFNRNHTSQFRTLYSAGKVVGHYTQLVWAKTSKIGCGAMKYKEHQFNRFYLVCNYGPAGNYYTYPVYLIK